MGTVFLFGLAIAASLLGCDPLPSSREPNALDSTLSPEWQPSQAAEIASA